MMTSKLAWSLLVASGILLAGVLLYVFGTPTSSPSPGIATESEASPRPGAVAREDNAAADEAPTAGEVVDGEVPAPDPASPLAIEIPGCVCHSDDPDIVAEHETYRMNQCAGCHMGGMPAMDS